MWALACRRDCLKTDITYGYCSLAGKRKRLGGSSGGSDEEESDADAADAPTGIVLSTAAPEETLPVTVLQVVFALLMAGAGLVCAGIWLDRAQVREGREEGRASPFMFHYSL